MDAIAMLKERRSIRKYKNEVVDRKLMEEIVDIARWAPSWTNIQAVRYTIVDNEEVIKQLANDGVKGFVYNIKTLENAKGVVVLSYLEGKSGTIPEKYGVEDKSSDMSWEAFDAGIACQTFCLAAHAKGVGTCIFGVIKEKSIAQIVNLPAEENVAALIVYGYAEDSPAPTPRLEAKDIMRFI